MLCRTTMIISNRLSKCNRMKRKLKENTTYRSTKKYVVLLFYRSKVNLLEEQLPIALYDAEWRIMSDKLNNKKYVSFTNSEKRIPKIFGFVYGAIIIALGVYALIQYVI